MKKRFIATWDGMPGAFHDEDAKEAAIGFAMTQAAYNSPEYGWTVTDSISQQVIARADGTMSGRIVYYRRADEQVNA